MTKPAYKGAVGIPVHAVANDGSSADITLNNFRFEDTKCIGQSACLIFDLSFVGTSPAAFHFSESFVAWTFDDAVPSPGQQATNGEVGGDPSANYVRYLPPNPLRVGSVTNGQSRRGLVMSDFGGGHHTNFVLSVADEANPGGDPEAAWLLRTP